MKLKDKLPVSYLLFTKRGRISRLSYWTVSIFIWTSFYILFNALAYSISYSATWIIYPVLFWALGATATKRLHDSNKSGYWLFFLLIPVAGPLLLFYLLGFRRGNRKANGYGTVPGVAPDYLKNDSGLSVDKENVKFIINDVTRLNPIAVAGIIRPADVAELKSVIRNVRPPLCIGGGRFSMGGQTASNDSMHIDMRLLNKVLDFNKATKTIKVEAGIRWCDIQRYIDPYDLSIKIMQTYANFTVGGSLNVNVHGRYIGLGPLILSVRSIDVIMANGEQLSASRDLNPEIFFACIGCYNAIAVIIAAELDLEDNIPVMRVQQKMRLSHYKEFFFNNIRNQQSVVFHNGDIYAPNYKNVRAVSWVKTDKRPTVKTRLMPLAAAYPVERYFIGAFSRSNFGKWRREYIIDPLLYIKKKIHWRNYEAGYDVAELEPGSRLKSTFVLQEYFVPVQRFDDFTKAMKEIFTRHHVNVLNVSIRHSKADSGSLMAWAREEVFAFVVYYKQGTDPAAKGKVAVWTRELMQAAIDLNGSYYLPYQAHATGDQFQQAFPKAKKLFELKRKYDPGYKFRNVIWDSYYHQ